MIFYDFRLRHTSMLKAAKLLWFSMARRVLPLLLLVPPPCSLECSDDFSCFVCQLAVATQLLTTFVAGSPSRQPQNSLRDGRKLRCAPKPPHCFVRSAHLSLSS